MAQRLCALPPWEGQQIPQLMAPLHPIVLYEATMAGFGGTMVGSLV